MAVDVSAAPSSMPQLQSVQKAMALPSVGAAVGQFGALYTKVKGAHSLLEWALSTAEAGVQRAAVTAAPYAAPYVATADARVAAAIEQLGRRVPLVNEPPKVIVETTKQAVLARVGPHVNKVCGARIAAEQRVKSLKDLSWAKANALLSTAYGQKAMQGVDTGATYAMQLLDHYLPPVTQDTPTEEIVPARNDPTLHAMQTVGRLSSVAARRVWSNLAFKINELRQAGIELDVRRYIAALLAALHLATVTRSQQQQETQSQEKERQENNMADPLPPPEAPKQQEGTTPSTTEQVKPTPEGKSKATKKLNDSKTE